MQTFPSVTPRSVSTSSSHRSTPSRDLTSTNHDIVNSTMLFAENRYGRIKQGIISGIVAMLNRCFNKTRGRCDIGSLKNMVNGVRQRF